MNTRIIRPVRREELTLHHWIIRTLYTEPTRIPTNHLPRDCKKLSPDPGQFKTTCYRTRGTCRAQSDRME
jgi:hypothetical protein